MNNTANTSDFHVANHGSICILTPLSELCRQWVEDHVGDENTQTWGRFGVVIEPRYLEPILEGLDEAGFLSV